MYQVLGEEDSMFLMKRLSDHFLPNSDQQQQQAFDYGSGPVTVAPARLQVALYLV